MKPAGKFDLPGAEARGWLDLINPSGVSNADVLKPFIGGDDITDGSKDRWTVDFNQMSLEEAEKYRRPIKYVLENVKPERDKNNEKATRENWWRYKRPVPALRAALVPLTRFMATSAVSKHRTFVWLSLEMLPNNALTVIAVDDALTFGILNSAVHVIWADAKGTAMGVGNDSRYTPTTTFETFPFPRPTPAQRKAIEEATLYLMKVRDQMHEQSAPGRNSEVKVSLTGMYNLLEEYRATGNTPIPAIVSLDDAHKTLDKAVAAAYQLGVATGREHAADPPARPEPGTCSSGEPGADSRLMLFQPGQG